MAGAGHQRQHGQPYSRPRAQPPSQPQSISTTRAQATGSNRTAPISSSSSPKTKLRTSCDACQEAKLGCSQEKPTCRRCLRHGTSCVYSPFRRIGRPRKTTNPRPTSTGDAEKARFKNTNVGEKGIPKAIGDTDNLPDADADCQFGFMSFDPVPAPPSSPISIDEDSSPWYPFPSDVNSVFNGLHMNMSTPASIVDDMDPFSNTSGYLDLESSFDNHHSMLMADAMSKADENMFGRMNPTPPSSTSAEIRSFGRKMSNCSDLQDSRVLANGFAHRHNDTTASGSSGSPLGLGLTLRTPSIDFAELDSRQPNGRRSNNVLDSRRPLQITNETYLNNRAFAPSPELTPPLSAQIPNQNPCNKRCSTSLIQRLATLNEHLSEAPNPSLDTTLHAERVTSSLCKQVLGCKSCVDSGSSYLLLSMVIEQVMRLLETIPDEGASESCTLLVGSFEIDDKTKAGFVKGYLLSRLEDFANMLTELARTVGQGLEDYNSKAAKEMVRDIYQRLEMLRGIVQLWE